MHYKIYIPDCRGYSPEHLARVGLSEILDPGCPASGVDCLAGPDGGFGVVFHWGDHPQPGYHRDAELWTECKPRGELPAGRFWLGQTRGDRPHPADLLRTNHLGGEPAVLADGREWLIPIARSLPHRFTIGDDGLPRRVVREEYEDFFRRSQEYFSLFITWRDAHQSGDLTVPKAWQFAIDALRLNYRISAELVDWLGLLDDVSILRLIGATYEWEKFLELDEKKKRVMAGGTTPEF